MADDLDALFDKQFGGGAPAAAPQAIQPATLPPPISTAPQGSLDDAFDARFGGGQTKKQTAPGTAGSMPEAALSGFVEGIPIVGPSLKSGAIQLQSKLSALISGKSYEEELAANKASEESSAAAHPTAKAIGRVAGQVAGYGTMAALMPEAFGIDAASLPAGMVASGFTNAAVSGLDAYVRGEDPTVAMIAGGTMGAAAPIIGRAVSNAFESTITPRIARLADDAINKYGIKLGADQLDANPLIQRASDFAANMPLARSQAGAQEARMGAWYKAIADQLGENVPKIDDAAMASAKARIGAGYDSVLNNMPAPPLDGQFAAQRKAILDELNNPTAHDFTPGETKAITGLSDLVSNGFKQDPSSGQWVLDPNIYKNLIRDGSKLDSAIDSKNANISEYASKFKAMLDGLVQRGAPANLVDQLKTLDRQYWTMKTVQPLIENDRSGSFTPEAFSRAVAKNTNNFAYGGGGELGDLADIGTSFLKTAKDPNADKKTIVRWLGEAALGGAGHLLGGPATAAVAVGAPVVAGRIAGGIAHSPTIANRLVQGAINPGGWSLSGAALPIAKPVLPAIAQQSRPLVQNMLPSQLSLSPSVSQTGQ